MARFCLPLLSVDAKVLLLPSLRSDLFIGAAQGDALDIEVLALLDGYRTTQQQSKRSSFRHKFIKFAQEQGAFPLIPTKASTYYRYMLWLTRNGINSGWDGALKYVTAVVQWNLSFGYEDARMVSGNEFWWLKFRQEFKRLVPVSHKAMKLPIRAGHLEAMAQDCDLSNAVDLRDLASYYTLFFFGVRIAHVAATSGAPTHAMRFEDLFFWPTLQAPEIVYVCFRSTKTRPRAAGTPFWSAVRRQPQLPFCPVLLLREHFLRAFQGCPTDFLFQTASGANLSRSTFTATLRRRLAAAAWRLEVPVDLTKFSGVSFRKGCLSTLGALGVPSHRLADHADHASVESSRIYTVDTLVDRAANSSLIASAFQPGTARL